MLIEHSMAYTPVRRADRSTGPRPSPTITALLAVWLALPSGAAAHAPPQIIDVVTREGAGPVFVTNRGLILADSSDGPFRLLCTEATKTNTSEKPDLLLMPEGTLILATSRGLIRSTDAGCSFQAIEPLGELLVPAAAQHPDDPEHFYVSAFDAERGGLFETHDGGASFDQLQPASESDFIATILLAPSQPDRMYIEGQLIAMDGLEPYVAVSDDGGESFERFEVPLLPTEDTFELLAVSPQDPDLLVGRAADADPVALQDRLLVSHDRGETWSSPATVHAMTEARFSADGTTLWVGGIDGVFRARGELTEVEQLPDAMRISLALEQQDALWLCGYYDGVHDGIGSVGADGNVQPVLAFSEVTEPAACDVTAPSTLACATLWNDWRREILGVRPDAGAPTPTPTLDAGSVQDAGPAADAAAPRPRPKRSSNGGCSALPNGDRGGTSGDALLMASAAALATRRVRHRALRGFSRG